MVFRQLSNEVYKVSEKGYCKESVLKIKFVACLIYKN